jgi:peptide chain release factor
MIRLLFTSGRGPAECRIAVRKAVATLVAEAASLGLETDCLEGPNVDGHGPASAIAVIHGRCRGNIRAAMARCNPVGGAKPAPAASQAEELVHRRVRAPGAAFEAFRAGGPGGQHQNKTESAVRATHIASGLSVVVREERSQHRNKVLALERMAALLRLQGEMAAITARNDAHAAHDRLERGRPVKRFKSSAFRAY